MLKDIGRVDDRIGARPIPAVRIRAWPFPKGPVGDTEAIIGGRNAGHVDLWQVRLEGNAWDAGKGAAWLSAEERTCYGAIRDDGERRRRARTRIALRGILSLYLARPPHRLKLRAALAGRPYLDRLATPIDFNVSHSGDRALIAVAAAGCCRVGVDLEKIVPLEDFDRLASTLCAPEERQALAEMPACDRLQSFFRTWTTREAVMKAIGTGWSRAPPLSLARRVSPAIEPTPVALPDSRHCWISTFEPAAGYAGALAIIS